MGFIFYNDNNNNNRNLIDNKSKRKLFEKKTAQIDYGTDANQVLYKERKAKRK